MPKKQKQKQKQIVKQSVVVKIGDITKPKKRARVISKKPVSRQEISRPYYSPIVNPNGPIIVQPPPPQRTIYRDEGAESIRNIETAFNNRFRDLEKYQRDLLREYKAESATLKQTIAQGLQNAFLPRGSTVPSSAPSEISQQDFEDILNREAYNYTEPIHNEVLREQLENSFYNPSQIQQNRDIIESAREPESELPNLTFTESIRKDEIRSLVPEEIPVESQSEIEQPTFLRNMETSLVPFQSPESKVAFPLKTIEEVPKTSEIALQTEFKPKNKIIVKYRDPTEEQIKEAMKQYLPESTFKEASKILETSQTQTESELEDAFGVPVYEKPRAEEPPKKRGGRPKKVSVEERVEELRGQRLTEEEIQSILQKEEQAKELARQARLAKKEVKEAKGSVDVLKQLEDSGYTS